MDEPSFLNEISVKGMVVRHAKPKVPIKEAVARLSELGAADGAAQIFDAGMVVDRMHLVGAYIQAANAFANGSNISGSMAVEMLLYAAMTSQISEAIGRIGAKEGKGAVAFFSTAALAERAEGFLELGDDFDRAPKEAASVALKYGIRASGKEAVDLAVMQGMALIGSRK